MLLKIESFNELQHRTLKSIVSKIIGKPVVKERVL